MKVEQHFIRAEVSMPDGQRAEGAPFEFDVTFATATPVRRRDWDAGGQYFDEVLDISAKAIESSRIDAGLPFLNSHSSYDLESVLGRSVSWSIEGGKAKARIRLSGREEIAGIRKDIEDGILTDISVGYRVLEYRKENVKPGTNEVAKYTAVRWMPMEISLVPVPADIQSGIGRSENPNPETFPVKIENMEETPKIETQRAVDSPPAPVDNSAAIRAAAEAERKRISEINTLARKHGLDEAFAGRHIDGNSDIATVRAAILDELDRKQVSVNGVNISPTVGDDRKVLARAAMTDALLIRSGVDVATPAKGVEDFRGRSLLRMAEHSLEFAGENTRGMTPREIATRAMSTGDFPIILGNTVNRTLRAAYEAQERTFMPWTRRANARDFRDLTRAQLSGLTGGFKQIVEGAEYKQATMSEAKETYKIAKYGHIISLTWETIVNDDLDAFSRVPAATAAEAAEIQSDIVYGILSANANMSDGVALFHANHGNLAASGSAITTTSLSVARAAMRKQTGLNGRKINLRPKFLIVGPDKETEALQILKATIVATKTADTNVFMGSMDLIVDSRIEGNAWYLAAAPTMIDTVEYAFLDGEPELFTEQRNGFEVDGIDIKARMLFAAKAIDWRGLYKNPGA